MNLNKIAPRQALNKAFLKVKPSRGDIEIFKTNLIRLIDKINEDETEEFHKNLVSLFLRETYYGDKYFINTKGRNDLVIHTGKDAHSPVGVIIETKSPVNTAEMLRKDKINTKAFQELVLYYMRERITGNNLEIKYLIAANIYEWFIFDADVFEKAFARNSKFVKLFNDFEAGRLVSANTDFFYKQVAELEIDAIEHDITFTHFDIRDYEKPLRNDDKRDDNKLIALYKLLSPEHLLKLPFANDSNSLDKTFYSELLHIIGLTETKNGGKKLIERKKAGERDAGALIENAINQLDSLDKLSRLPRPQQFGETQPERLFNAALELVITWINRVLFLKLLEAQLIKYHKGDDAFAFLNTGKVPDYDALNSLFFQVLAKKPEERNAAVKKLFANVPYLNSSLFEPTELEHNGVFISQLNNEKIPVLATTVLKDGRGRKKSGGMDALEYLFEFLDAYDFSSEGAEDIQEDNKTLINASVLGLIFEKINGYKDGSFFTPGFITMYMCREAIRRAVVRKFNDAKGWNCENLDRVFDKIADKQEANGIINSLKICDPAVGSGHFLVSALNEIIAIKSELKILLDRQGKTLRDYQVEVVNDELIVTDDDGRLFEYNPNNKESQRVQEALFHEKQTIIESCLFGVDINPNSVKICRLRLWIELLKNAYYKSDSHEAELETLPNIDINIKCGNSLISRYALDTDIKKALRKSKWTIASYRLAVMAYRNAGSKDEKRSMEKLIDTIKHDFESEINHTDKRSIRFEKLSNELNTLLNQRDFFEISQAAKNEQLRKVKKLTAELQKLEAEIETVKSNKIYENAFEWRFEFPEVLNDDGEFVGFDIVIGNPPYVSAMELKKSLSELTYRQMKFDYQTAKGTVDLFIYFFERGLKLIKDEALLSYITPNRYLSASYGEALREFLFHQSKIIEIIDYSQVRVFKEASTYPIVTSLRKSNSANKLYSITIGKYDDKNGELKFKEVTSEKLNYLEGFIWGYLLNEKMDITEKVINQSISITNCATINGTSTAAEADNYHKLINSKTGFKLINTGTIDRYESLWGKSELTDKGKRFLTPYLANSVSEISNNRINLYSSPKIILAKIAITTEAFYDAKGEYASVNTNCFHSFNVNFDPRYILAWLNSKLFQYTFECFFEGLKMQGGYLLYSSPNVSKMFIKKVDIKEQKPFIELVDQILSAKGSDPGADTRELEREIDKLVYALYGLTEEEIKIVEGKA